MPKFRITIEERVKRVYEAEADDESDAWWLEPTDFSSEEAVEDLGGDCEIVNVQPVEAVDEDPEAGEAEADDDEPA